ncbi:MAG: Mut7-C RNAse domain-containing protein [Marinilabiliaceae bacterium]
MTAMIDQFSRGPGFICDGHLGKLCKYLRMLGFDCLFVHLAHHPDVAGLNKENRIVLSRDHKLRNHPEIQQFILIVSSDPITQLHEVVRQVDLVNFIWPLSRCLQCNAPLSRISKNQILHKLEPGTARDFDEFHQCSECGRIYWKGSHYENMMTFIKTKVLPFNNHYGPGNYKN